MTKPKTTKPKAPSTASATQLSKGDLSALDSFCKDLCYDEISFDSWQQTNQHLDLHVPVSLSPSLAVTGGELSVSFSRQIREDEKTPWVRQKTTVVAQIPPGSRDGDKLAIPQQGDRFAKDIGTLILLLRIKPSN